MSSEKDKVYPTITNDESPNDSKEPPNGNPKNQDESFGQVTERQISTKPIDIKQRASSSGLEQSITTNTITGSGNADKSNHNVDESVPIQSIIQTANNMSSMMIAHRIALEDDFKLEPGLDISGPMMSLSPIIGSSPISSKLHGPNKQTEPTIQVRVKDIVHDAFWDLFREELKSHGKHEEHNDDQSKNEKCYDISKQLLLDMRQKIFDLLLPQHAKLKQDIEDRLDPQIIDQLCKVDSLDFKDYGNYILSILSKLCAPVRDENIQELSNTNDIVQLYRGIMELLELMRLDFANFTLNRFKPHIKAHSQDYEREKFNEILKQQKAIGIDGLEYTRIWLCRAIEKIESSHGLMDLIQESRENLDLVDDDSSSSPQDQLKHPSEPSNTSTSQYSDSQRLVQKIQSSDIVTKVLTIAYCELLDWKQDVQELYPETLICDESTFKHISEQTKILIITSSILLTAFAFVQRFRVADDPNFKSLIKSHVITLLTATYDNDNNVSTKQKMDEKKTKQQNLSSMKEDLGQAKLETIVTQLTADLRQKVEKDNTTLLGEFDKQIELFKRQILDLESPTNRVRELSKRRILEFIETVLVLDVKHQQKKRMPPPVNIPLGLNCLANEITLITAQLVKIIRYNRRVFFTHYRDIIVESVGRKLEKK